MRKSLNDSLREEFAEILAKEEPRDFIKLKKLDTAIIGGAFEKLLSGHKVFSDQEEDIERVRSEFENYIINTLKTKQH